jgi:hypothetical protein
MASYADEFAYQMTVSPGEVSYGYAARPGAPLSRLVLNDSGVVERLGWDPGSRAWNNFFQGPRDVCDKYDMCGPSGVCNASAAATSFCSCVVGVQPRVPNGLVHEGKVQRMPAERAAGLRRWQEVRRQHRLVRRFAGSEAAGHGRLVVAGIERHAG